MRPLLLFAFAVALTACGQSQPKGAQPPAPQPVAASTTATAAADDPSEFQERVSALPAPYNGASYEAGRRVFAQCRSCHTIEEGGPNRVGPNLHGVIGREAGSKEGFNYSPAMRSAGFAWNAERLDAYLTNPRAYVPNNRMAFVGVRNETQRRDLIAYLLATAGQHQED